MAELSKAINLDEIAVGSPRGVHDVTARQVAEAPDRIALVRALNQIPADQGRAIVLHHLCDLSVEDVAREVGAPAGTVKARLSRGRAALTALLDPTDPGYQEGATHV